MRRRPLSSPIVKKNSWILPCLMCLPGREKFNKSASLEVGRWNNTPREDRKCGLCEANQIGNEFHYVLECSALSHVRKKLFSDYYLKNPNTLKFRTLMSLSNHVILMKMCTLIRKIFDLVGHPT